MKTFVTPESDIGSKPLVDLSQPCGGTIAYNVLSEAQAVVKGMTETAIHVQASKLLGPGKKYTVTHTLPDENTENPATGFWSWSYHP